MNKPSFSSIGLILVLAGEPLFFFFFFFFSNFLCFWDLNRSLLLPRHWVFNVIVVNVIAV